jgi:hypothetical protein
VNSRPDFRRPVHVHAAPRGEQCTVSATSPCRPAITRAYSAAWPAGVFVPKQPASNSADPNAPALVATSAVRRRRGRPIFWRGASAGSSGETTRSTALSLGATTLQAPKRAAQRSRNPAIPELRARWRRRVRSELLPTPTARTSDTGPRCPPTTPAAPGQPWTAPGRAGAVRRAGVVAVTGGDRSGVDDPATCVKPRPPSRPRRYDDPA